jgi:SAM-dependent methyltransferase
MAQSKQNEWNWQWQEYQDDSLFLFKEWILPHTMEVFRNKHVVECGCGGGQHTAFVAPYAKSVVAIDLNTTELARERNKEHDHIDFVDGDLATVQVAEQADVAFCIGVIHHTDDPDKTFANIKNFVRPGGQLLLWCYSKEGNFLNWAVLEPLKRWFLLKLPKPILNLLAFVLTALIYPIVYSVYLLPLKFLPYFQYFENWRKLSFKRNQLNVFDKLNAPTTHFITKERVLQWFNNTDFTDVVFDHYKGVSWRVSGIKV